MKRFLTRWYLLNKRIFKKPVFILILCTVPILVLALNLVTQNSDGFVNITIALEDRDDESAKAIRDKLLDSSRIVNFTECDSVDEAQERVSYGEADAAWIISADVDTRISDFVNGRKTEPCVTVIEREDSVALRLCREKLSAALSHDMSYELMRSSYREKVGGDLSDDELRSYYENAFSVKELFEFRRTTGELADDTDLSYLMLPIRGVLAVAILLCGFALAMFWITDEKRMVFCRITGRVRPVFELGYHLTGIIDIAVIVLISLYAAGLGNNFLHELASIAVYALNCAVFVILIRRLLKKIGIIAAVTPLIIVLVIVVNPILINLPLVYPLRVLTPVYYYLQSTHDKMYILYGLIYFAAVAGADLLLYWLSNRSRRSSV